MGLKAPRGAAHYHPESAASTAATPHLAVPSADFCLGRGGVIIVLHLYKHLALEYNKDREVSCF